MLSGDKDGKKIRIWKACRFLVMAGAVAVVIAVGLSPRQGSARGQDGADSGDSGVPLLIAAGATIADYDGVPSAAETDDAYVPELTMTDADRFLGGSCCEPAAAACSHRQRSPQMYIGGIIGASFATLALPPDDATNRSVFTAGGTLGVAFDRPVGALRLEVEGRGRDVVSETVVAQDDTYSITGEATDIWSTTVNLWRDFAATETLGAYLGGGIGAGGYRSVISVTEPFTDLLAVNDPTSTFAWQAGCGLTYAITPRATLDVGYRFFALNESTATGTAFDLPYSYRTGFSASELLFTLRIYEPFRGWR
ncbi:MAG: outer membrane beta-barrel protein [Planctomycetota bacterium]|nr:outer membrane beta-barrel protein [Planctomycetota bacterium]